MNAQEHEARAIRCWGLMNENEKMAVRIGMSPFWTCQKDLGGKAPGEGFAEIEGCDDHRLAAVALMEIARNNGGMIA